MLRRALLAVTVLHDLDLLPADEGVLLPSAGSLLLTWENLSRCVDGADPQARPGRVRLARYARARARFADPTPLRLRPVAMPVDHPRHPGRAWTRQTVAGGILDVGLGLAGLQPAQPERIVPLPPTAAGDAGLDSEGWYDEALVYLDEMAGLAAARFRRRPGQPLRPMGDCDVVTLLAARTFRRSLVAAEPGGLRGMRTAAAPTRDRGWLDLRHVDPAFVACAAAASEPDLRGFSGPLLVTADELTMAGPRGWYSPASAAAPAVDSGRGHGRRS